MKRKITFVDNGQDFLWWIVDENGKVVDCRPFQASIWTQYTVVNDLTRLKKGHKLGIRKGDEFPVELKHAVRKVEIV